MQWYIQVKAVHGVLQCSVLDPAVKVMQGALQCSARVPDQGVGEALRRGWRARSGESALVLRTQSRREESERAAEAETEVEPEAKTQAEEEEEVAAAASTPLPLTNLLLYATSSPATSS